jgi:hypothetical protein
MTNSTSGVGGVLCLRLCVTQAIAFSVAFDSTDFPSFKVNNDFRSDVSPFFV